MNEKAIEKLVLSEAMKVAPTSWVIVSIHTGQAIAEVYKKESVDRLNSNNFKAVPIKEYLAGLNK